MNHIQIALHGAVLGILLCLAGCTLGPRHAHYRSERSYGYSEYSGGSGGMYHGGYSHHHHGDHYHQQQADHRRHDSHARIPKQNLTFTPPPAPPVAPVVVTPPPPAPSPKPRQSKEEAYEQSLRRQPGPANGRDRGR
ncbi:MAG: hypothetical protein WD768_00180 [Phycisphaeraceae bacterium]